MNTLKYTQSMKKVIKFLLTMKVPPRKVVIYEWQEDEDSIKKIVNGG